MPGRRQTFRSGECSLRSRCCSLHVRARASDRWSRRIQSSNAMESWICVAVWIRSTEVSLWARQLLSLSVKTPKRISCAKARDAEFVKDTVKSLEDDGDATSWMNVLLHRVSIWMLPPDFRIDAGRVYRNASEFGRIQISISSMGLKPKFPIRTPNPGLHPLILFFVLIKLVKPNRFRGNHLVN